MSELGNSVEQVRHEFDKKVGDSDVPRRGSFGREEVQALLDRIDELEQQLYASPKQELVTQVPEPGTEEEEHHPHRRGKKGKKDGEESESAG